MLNMLWRQHPYVDQIIVVASLTFVCFSSWSNTNTNQL